MQAPTSKYGCGDDACVPCYGDEEYRATRCECGNRITPGETTDGKCDWCASGEVIGVAGGTRIGTCEADGRPIFRSHMAGTIYHATEDR